jgi:hypothetical protein
MRTLNLKTIVAFLAIMIGGMNAFAQNTAGKLEDMGRIALNAYVPDQVESMPEAARSMLLNKLNQITTQSGMGGSPLNPRFIITPKIVVMTKDLTATAPPMTAITLDVTLYIGDGLDGTKFASTSVSVKGVGVNETKAYIEAIKGIKPADPTIQAFVDKGKTKILEYYNTRCDFIIKEAKVLESQLKYEEAILKLTSVPEVAAECYKKSMDAAMPLYQKQIDRQCKVKLQEANTAWNTNQNESGATAAGEILNTIDPNSACYGEVKALNNKIAARIKEINNREWQYVLKEQSLEGDRIKAIRDVGVAYGNGQPKTVNYNVRGWY